MIAAGLLLPHAGHSQSVPAMQFDAGYVSALRGQGYAFSLGVSVVTLAISPGLALELGASTWYGHTDVKTNSLLHRSVVGAGPFADVLIAPGPSGLQVDLGLGLQYLHSQNNDYIGFEVTPASGADASPVEDRRGTKSSSAAVSAALGVRQPISAKVAAVLSVAVLREQLFAGAVPWIYQLRAGLRWSLR